MAMQATWRRPQWCRSRAAHEHRHVAIPFVYSSLNRSLDWKAATQGFYAPVSGASLQETGVYWVRLEIFGSFLHKRATIVQLETLRILDTVAGPLITFLRRFQPHGPGSAASPSMKYPKLCANW